MKTLSDVQQIQKQYDFFLKPDVHLTCAKHSFGITELRTRIGIAFELANYINFA